MSGVVKSHTRYHIGTPGKAWTEVEKSLWRSEQTKKRDYFTDVVSPLMRFTGGEVFQYGTLDYRSYGAAKYPLYAVKSSNWDSKRPMVLVTGGVHGYEASGIHGSLLFLKEKFVEFSEKVNVLVLPCLCPWGYETINRWNPEAIDPNRCFNLTNPGCLEASQAMAAVLLLVQKSSYVLQHTDLHETTDTDNSEFTPAKAARDGEDIAKWYPIPDGFYLIGDITRPEVEWHEAMIAAVQKVTHIAEPDEKNTIIDEPVVKPGILICPAIGDCGSHTNALYATTTEVYPDSPKVTDENCNQAQVAAVSAGLQYALIAKGLM